MVRQTKKLPFLVLLCVVGLLATALQAATNYISSGEVINLSWSTTAPSSGDPVVKATTKAAGGISGVSLVTATASQLVPVAINGIFDLSVTANGDDGLGGPIAVGDYVFASLGGVEVCTTTLSALNTGLIFGVALEAVASGTTATINVLLIQSGD